MLGPRAKRVASAIVAPASPADCFDMAIESVRLAVKFMTPVFYLSDGYLANSAEPWRIPDVASLPEITVEYATDPATYQPYLRDPETQKPLVWDADRERAVPFDDPACVRPAMEGAFIAARVEVGADVTRRSVCERVRPAFALLLDHVRPYTPEWAQEIADVPAATIRRLAADYLQHATVGATIEIDGVTYPHRPVAVLLGKSVTNGWGGYE